MLKHYLKLMRPYQWIKNSFCWCGFIFGFHLHDNLLLYHVLLAFFSFCFASSSVYVLNDYVDIEIDRQHPKKKKRPLASGAISKLHGLVFYAVLLVVTFALAAKVSYYQVAIIATYIVLNIYYSFHGKHVVILDVFIISFGFLLRVFAGTWGVAIAPSEWLLLCVISLTLFLGFSKRRAELLQCEKLHASLELKRRVLEHYEPRMLDLFVGITATATLIAYALFVVVAKQQAYLVYTCVIVFYAIFRYIYLLYKQNGGQDTANDLLDDKHLIAAVVLWVASYLAVFLWV